MTWAFIPPGLDMAFLSAPDMAGSTLGCSLPNPVFIPAALLKSNPLPKPRWSQEWWVDLCPVLPNMAPDLRDLDRPPQRNGAPDLSGRPRCGTTCAPSSVTTGAGISTRSSGPWIWAPSDGAETDNPQQMSLFA